MKFITEQTVQKKEVTIRLRDGGSFGDIDIVATVGIESKTILALRNGMFLRPHGARLNGIVTDGNGQIIEEVH